MYVVVFN